MWHSGQAALCEAEQEATPERLVLAVPDIHPEDLAGAVGGDPGGHHDRHRDHLAALAGFVADGAQRDHQVVHAAGGHALDGGLHQHRVQRLVDTAPGLEDRGEERALPQLRDPQLHIVGLGGQQLRPGAVAFGDTVLGALIPVRADHPGRFELDQLLQHQAHALTDQVHAITGTERLEQLGQGRLGQGHRWYSFSASLGRFTPKIPPMAANLTRPRR